MALTKERIQELVKNFGKTPEDTGSTEVQIAALTDNISILTEHMKKNHKDFSTRRGLLKMVARRRKLLKYLQSEDEKRYREIKTKLGLK